MLDTLTESRYNTGVNLPWNGKSPFRYMTIVEYMRVKLSVYMCIPAYFAIEGSNFERQRTARDVTGEGTDRILSGEDESSFLRPSRGSWGK